MENKQPREAHCSTSSFSRKPGSRQLQQILVEHVETGAARDGHLLGIISEDEGERTREGVKARIHSGTP